MTTPPSSAARPASELPGQPSLERLILPLAAVGIVGLAVFGFQDFYFRGQQFPARPIPPPLAPLVFLHGITMSLWLVALCVQVVLVAKGMKRLHMRIGKIGAGIGLLSAISGAALAIVGTRHKPEMIMFSLNRLEFLSIPLLSGLAFMGGIVAAIVWRRQREVHGSLIFLSTLLAVSAAIGRISFLHTPPFDGAVIYIFGPYFWSVVLAWLLYFVKATVTRRFGGFLPWGCAGLTVFCAGSVAFSRTGLWHSFAALLVGP